MPQSKTTGMSLSLIPQSAQYSNRLFPVQVPLAFWVDQGELIWCLKIGLALGESENLQMGHVEPMNECRIKQAIGALRHCKPRAYAELGPI
jgi:hypothetical protein